MYSKKNESDDKTKTHKKVNPLKDWRIVCNKDDIQLIEGEEILVPIAYIQNLKTEKVIK